MGRPIVDLVGKKFGYLTVVSINEDKSTNAMKYWDCKCECGNIACVQGGRLKNGDTTSCGCHKYDYLKILHQKNITQLDKGSKYGEWEVIERDNYLSSKRGMSYYVCKCSCGTVKSVKSDPLLSGRSTSCGCIKSKGEKKINAILKSFGIDFEKQKTFSGCVDKIPLRFDFYIPSLDMCIEYNGVQHYSVGCGWNTEEKLLNTKRHDNIKRVFCSSNNIILLTVPYTLFHYLDNNIFALLIVFYYLRHYFNLIWPFACIHNAIKEER